MADATNAQGTQAIDVAQESQLQEWSRTLGVTPEDLKQAVAEVGGQPDRVREYFEQRQGAGYNR